MKSISESLLNAMYDVTILEELESVWKRTAKNAVETARIQDKFKKICDHDLKGQKISLDNKQELRKLYKLFLENIPFGNDTQKREVLKRFGLATEEGFRKWVLGSHDEMEKLGINTDWVKQWDESEAEKQYKKAKDAGEIPATISDDDADDRDLVIYDRWNPSTHAVYSFKGKRGKGTDRQVNLIRMDFKYEYDVKYYDCYPILAKNYYGHEEELKKRAEYQQGYDDPNEFK